jgi:hypothetical protein
VDIDLWRVVLQITETESLIVDQRNLALSVAITGAGGAAVEAVSM